MARYDEIMNPYGHYSEQASKGKPPRSAILDEILASGQTLASDYAKHYPVATPEPAAPSESATPESDVATPSKHGKHAPGYWAEYRKRKAQS